MSQAKNFWFKIEINIKKSQIEVAQAILAEAGAVGLWCDDGDTPGTCVAQNKLIVNIFAYFEPTNSQAGLVTCIQESARRNNFVFSEIKISREYEQSWQENFVRSCKILCLDPDIYIVPKFELKKFLKTNNKNLFIIIDPENSFGTGYHESTQLAIKAVCTHIAKLSSKQIINLSALDVGSGSGVLAILLAKLGLKNILATDICSHSIKTAQNNAKLNKVNFNIKLVDNNFNYKFNKYDLIIANILAPVLLELAPQLARALKPGGVLIFSGLLCDQVDLATQELSNLDLVEVQVFSKNSWSCAIWQKN